jgi:multiple sugar transport system substrate-binding protein
LKKAHVCLVLVVLFLFVFNLGVNAQVTTIRYLGHTFEPTNVLVQELIAEFEALNPDIKVEYEWVTSSQYEEKLLTELAAGIGPDLWHVRDRSFLTFFRVGAFAPIMPSAFGVETQEDILALYDPGTMEPYMMDGVLYGVPKEHNILTLYYRMDHFREAGLDPNKPPTTWDELVEMGKLLTQRDNRGRLLRSGFEWNNAASGKLTRFASILYQAGGDFFNEDMTESIINNEAGLKAAETYIAPIKAGIYDPGFHLEEDFENGRVSMTTSGPYLPSNISLKYPHLEYGVDYAAAPYPVIEGGEPAAIFTGWGWVVNARSQNQEAAWKFIAFMAEHPGLWLQRTGFIQPRKGLLDDPVAETIPQLETFLDLNPIMRTMPRTPIYVEMQEPFVEMIDRIALEGMDPQEALDILKAELDELLRIYNQK